MPLLVLPFLRLASVFCRLRSIAARIDSDHELIFDRCRGQVYIQGLIIGSRLALRQLICFFGLFRLPRASNLFGLLLIFLIFEALLLRLLLFFFFLSLFLDLRLVFWLLFWLLFFCLLLLLEALEIFG